MEKRNKGTISVPIATVGAVIIAAVSWTASYFGNVIGQKDAIAQVKSEFQQDIGTTNVTVASEKSRSDQFEKRLDRFENKLDALLEKSGINSKKIQ